MTLSTSINPDEITRLEQQIADGTATPQTRCDLARVYHEAGLLALQENRPTDAQNALARYLRLAPTSKERRETLRKLQNLVGDESLVCEGCGRKSPIAEAFQIKNGKLICPRCRIKKSSSHRLAFLSHFLFLTGISGGIALLTYPSQNALHFNATVFFTAMLLLPLVILIHEAAHALSALALGGKVYAFIIGQGKLIWRKRIGDCDISVRWDFQSGSARFGFSTVNSIKIRYFITILAPLLAHLLIGVFGLIYVDLTPSRNAYTPLALFILLNLFMLVLNAFPRMHIIDGWERPSDGAVLLKILQGKYSEQETHLASLTNEALAKLDAKRGNEALDALYAILSHSGLPPYGRGITENNVGWILLLQNKPELALEHARCAYVLLPWLPTVEGTFGAALVETGDVDAGILLLQNAKEISGLPEENASYLAHLALGYAKLGNMAESQQYWEQAIKLAPQEETVAHIRPKLERIGY